MKLILPNKKYALSFLKGEKEYKKEKTTVATNGGTGLFSSLKDFYIYNKKMIDSRKGINLRKDRVPATLYWAIIGKKVVGRLDLRHRMNKSLIANVGGHVGYVVVPSERQKGYATEMLRLGIKKAKKLGIKKVIVTCKETNIGSKKVIENNGGVFIKKDKANGVSMLVFYITS